ncbi:putative neprosin [Lupinus albus]|uniref:Putative neprosin n=1 Tax=Lupinus albus TaxID=3870 RepID=A0A6A4NWH7_LUPAL|nr:putative neprosin [Lupinus albus]
MAQPCIHISMFFVVLLLFLTSVLSRSITNHTIDLDKLSRIREQLEKINKPGVKTIKSQDGDIIDCVLFHEQPAFDLPELKDQKTTLQLPEWPEGYNINENTTTGFESFQLWSDSGEECPEGTVPILRITEQHLLRAGNMPRFGQKVLNNSQHEYAIVNVKQDKFYGAKTSINVWAPKVSQAGEFSLAQIWLASGSFEAKDLNTIEVGWQVFPDNYGGDKNPRLFGYWTRDAYETTGCHNLVCPGFVQIHKRIPLGATIKPISSYNGKQFQINLLVWKDPKNGNWWLSFGSGILIGYWPASLLPRLKSHADILQFGGEIVNCNRNGHTTTQMGSGHFAEEGFKKAAFFRDINLVNSANKVTSIPARNLLTPRNHPNCYNTKVSSGKGKGKVYDTHFFFGGPGKNPNCS